MLCLGKEYQEFSTRSLEGYGGHHESANGARIDGLGISGKAETGFVLKKEQKQNMLTPTFVQARSNAMGLAIHPLASLLLNLSRVFSCCRAMPRIHESQRCILELER
jgi:hypothetical protein